MITSLKLKNWRSHLDTSLKFGKGTNCFIGNIGTGKSSILSALCFGLFGTFPELQSKKVKLEDLIMKKPEQKQKAEIEVGFELNGDKYLVKRTITPGKTTAELRKNNELIESQTSKVTSEIENILKVDYDLFTRAIYSEQNNLDMFLTIPKGQRMKKMDQLLAIDKFEKARATVGQVKNRLSILINEKYQLIKNIEQSENIEKLNVLKHEIHQLKEQEQKMIEKLELVIKRKTITAQKIDELKVKEEKLNQVNVKIETNRNLISNLSKDIEKLKEELMEHAEKTTDDLKMHLQMLLEETNKLKENKKEEEENLEVLTGSHSKEELKIKILEEETIPKLKEQVKEFEKIQKDLKKLPTLKKKLKEKEKLYDTQRKLIEKNDAKITELTESIEEIKKAGSSCPICDSKLDAKKKLSLLAKKRNLIKKLKEEMKKINLNSIKTYIDKYNSEIRELELLEQKVSNIKNSKKELLNAEKQLKEIKAQSSFYLRKKKMFEKNIELIQKKIDEFLIEQERTRQLISKRIDIEEKIEKQKNLVKEIELLREQKLQLQQMFTPSMIETLRQEYRDLIATERELKTRIETNKTIIEQKSSIVAELERTKQIIEKYKDEINYLENLSSQLAILKDALVFTQEQLRINFIDAVNQAMQTIWNNIYPYNDYTSIKLEIENGDYVLKLQDINGWVNADGIVSGGERTIACLALRIAFSLVLVPTLRLLILDEPTANLDANGVKTLAEVLKNNVDNIVDQVFLITHNPEMEAAVSGNLYKLERDKNNNGFSIVNLYNE
ncbi:MAG: SMC family ATPase [Candidatus Aenigmarchaeota archaeon]|nr:SMC family ATPase [Candidatus Aenigmarchaeota archaeon]